MEWWKLKKIQPGHWVFISLLSQPRYPTCRGTDTWIWCLKMAHPPLSSHNHGVFWYLRIAIESEKLTIYNEIGVRQKIKMAEVIISVGCDWPKRRPGNKEQWALSSQLAWKKPPFWRVLLLFFCLFPLFSPASFSFCFLPLKPELRSLPHHYSANSGLTRQRISHFLNFEILMQPLLPYSSLLESLWSIGGLYFISISWLSID